jgi:ribosomal-protein-serine acetyltransferase
MLTLPTRQALRSSPLLTPRTYLMPMDPADSQELWQVIDESRVHLHPWLPWVPYNADEASTRRFVEACAAEWDAGRALRFIIRERTKGGLLGVVGLESCVHIHRACELGYWLRRDAQGHGLMSEASAEVLRLAFENLGVHRIRVAAATDNHRSLAVIGRLGFKFEGIARQAEFCANRWLDHAVFGMLETDWRAR